MNPFDGYLIPDDFFTEEINFQAKRKHIFCATEKKSGNLVALKRARSSDGVLAEASKLSHEFTILKTLDYPNIPKAFELISSGKMVTLVVEWIDSETLKSRIARGLVSLDDFFNIAISLTETLQYIHNVGIIHRDVNPSNILIDKNGVVKLIDFGISTNIHTEQNEKINLDLIEGTLVYMAPEQTGRTSYTITDSCDLYALGIVLYEMLAGKPPFDSIDPLEVIHFHLSRKPISLQKTNPLLPFGICALVEKLLEKNPDDRYQSEEGLLADLHILKSHFKNGTNTDNFIVAAKNSNKRYKETQKLYGREKETNQLLKSFDALSKTHSSLVLISGYAGIGKSVLVKQIQQPIIEKKAIFISGKFDQFKRNIPYFSFIEAFNDLIKNILSESDERISYWHKQLTLVLGENGGLITEVIPYLEMIIGKQAPAVKQQPAEHEFRFRAVLLDFIYAFSSPGSPLVIFLDDLHWADLPSLSLIERILLTSDSERVLIIGTYRDNEVNDMHPLKMTMEQLRANSIEINEIKLNQLNEKTTIQIVADSFEMDTEDAYELGQITFKKTNGNPFFINRFLKSLYIDKLVVYNTSGKWQWDKHKIEGLAYADNVVDLMSREISNLPEITRETMKMAAVLGNTFNLRHLSLILEQAQHAVFEALKPALKAGYLSPIDRNYRNLSLTTQGVGNDWKEESDKVTSSFKFMHDRVQQAAYSLISESEHDKVHLRTGRILLSNTKEENLSDSAFDIIGHFTHCLYLVKDNAERKKLAALFLLAGLKAKDSTSYDVAVIYLSNALKLDEDSGWNGNYKMTFDIYIALGESEFLDNDHDKAQFYFQELLKYAKTDLEKLRIYYIQSSLFLKLAKTKECLVVARKAMRLFGIRFPENPLAIKISAYWVMFRYLINFSSKTKKAEELMVSKECTDEQVVEINKFLVDMSTAAYQENQELMLLVVFKNVDQYLKYGFTDSSGWCFSSFAFVTLCKLGLSEKGFRLWDLTAKLSPRIQSESMRAKIDYLIDAMATHWRRPVGENTERILETVKRCNINGFPHYSGYSITNYISKKLASGIPIQEVMDLSADKMDYLKRVKHISGLDFSIPKIQMLKALSAKTTNFGDWEDEDLTMFKLEERIRENNNQSTLAHFYCSKLTLLFYFGKYRETIDVSNEGRIHFPYIVGQWVVVEWEFFTAISIAAYYSKFTKSEKKLRLKEFNNSLKQMKHWAKDCPENFDSYLNIMLAEISAIEGKFEESLLHYKEAIKSASKNGFIHIEAIANERAAIFLLQRGHDKMAQSFLKSAWELFHEWGAFAICKDLQNKYPSLLVIGKSEVQNNGGEIGNMQTIGTVNLVLDLGTILKASQSLASHVKLDELLQNLMYLVIENAGADRGCLLLNRNGILTIEAIGNSGPEGNQILESIPYIGSNLLPESIINYCWRVEGNIVVQNALKDETYSNDEYVKSNKILSMLCIPISEKGVKIGLLYLENRLLQGVFTKNRLDLLTMLSGQIGISIQNALLYENLEEKVQERTLEISKQQLKIEEEMKKSDKLLLNILPEKTANDLKTKGFSKAISYPNANVMFFDIVGFTKRAEKMQAEEIVEEIHELFSGMDDIVAKYKIEKIKTIGDAYMCVSGLNESSDPMAAINCIEAAKEVQILLERLNKDKVKKGRDPLQLRIGINSGLVIAGVVGKSKFSYDIWGDTVNLAARMETSGEVGKINLSYNTYIQVKDHYHCISRGKIEAKNKGLIEMFFIETSPSGEKDLNEISSSQQNS